MINIEYIILTYVKRFAQCGGHTGGRALITL